MATQTQQTPEEIAAAARARMLQQEAALPIDIHHNKFLDWLVDRKRIPESWKKSLDQIGGLIKAALTETPEYQNIQIDYYYAVYIRDLLKLSEGQKKDFFGRYSSKRMKDWDDIVRAYESSDIYLGEAAQYLVQQVNYEIPALKKSIQRHTATINEADKKIAESNRAIHDLQNSYEKGCKKLKIEGKDLVAEISALANELPEVFSKIVDIVQKDPSFVEGMEYYSQFCQYISPSSQSTVLEKMLQFTKYLAANGNAPMTRYYQLPDFKEESFGITLESEGNSSDTPAATIDWDIGMATIDSTIDIAASTSQTEPNQGSEINWDIDAVHVSPNLGVQLIGESGEDGSCQVIDWDISDVANDDANGGASIDWDVDVTTSVDPLSANDTISITSTTESAASLVITPTKESILEFSKTRNLFLNELLELEGFLKHRLEELDITDHVDIVHQLYDAPQLVQTQSKEKVRTYLKSVETLIDLVNGNRTRQLMLIKSSKKYVSRLCLGLQQKIDHAKRLERSIPILEKKKKDASASIQETVPILDKTIRRTKEIQTKVEASLSKIYNGRSVHIIGDINTL